MMTRALLVTLWLVALPAAAQTTPQKTPVQTLSKTDVQVRVTDGTSTSAVTSTNSGGKQGLDVYVLNPSGGGGGAGGDVSVTNWPAFPWSVNVANWPANYVMSDGGGSITVDGPLTDAQLRASAVPVSAATLPLPTGAATEATLGTVATNTGRVPSGLTAPTSAPAGTEAGLIVRNIPSGTQAVSGPLTDTQLRASAVPVSGTVNVTDGAGALNVIVDSSALPTGAATEATSSAMSAKLPASLGAKTGATSLSVVPASDATFTVSGTVTATPTGTQAVSGAVTVGGTQAFGATVSGQNPVVIGGVNNTGIIRALPTVTVTGENAQTLVPVAGKDADGKSYGIPTAGSGASVVVSGTTAATQSGTWNVRLFDALGNNVTTATTDPVGTERGVITRNIPSGTQAVSGTVTANAGTGPWPVTDNGGSLTVDGTVAVSSVGGTVAVSGPLTDAQLRASAVPVSGTVTATNPSVGTNAAAGPTSSTQVGWRDGSGNLQAVSAANPLPISGSISATNPSVGTNGAAAPTSSTQVGFLSGANLVSVSNANPLPITGSISASNPSVSSTGAAVPASATYTGVLSGGNLVGMSQPLTDTQLRASAVPVSASALPLPTGAATETTLGTRLAETTFTGRVPTNGQKTMAGSLPVVISSDQSAITIFNGTADAGNSSTATLGGGGVFTGTSFDAFNQGSVMVYVFSNVSSAANGLSLQWSNDGTNWNETAVSTFTAGSNAFTLQATHRGRYFRVVYTNGGAAQASFRLQTIHKVTTPSGDVVETFDAIAADNHVQLARSILSAENAAGTAVGDLVQTTAVPAGTEAGLIVRNIPSGTQAVSGTVTANAGTGPWPVTDNGGSLTVDGTVAVSSVGGTVAVSGPLTDAQLRATPVTVTDGAGAMNVIVDSGTTAATQSGTWSVRAQDGAGNALASSTTTPVGTEQALVVRNIPSGTQAVSGTVNVTDGAGALNVIVDSSALPTGAATESTLSTLNGKVPSGLTVTSTRLLTDGSGVTQPVSGTVTANAGTGSFTVAQATAANLRAQTASEQSTATATGSVATLTAGSVTTSVPSYTNGNAGALSLTPAGSLRTEITNGTLTVSGGVTISSGTVTANLGTIGTAATESTLSAVSTKLPASLGAKTSAASLSVTQASDGVFQVALAQTSGVIDSGSCTSVGVTSTTIAAANGNRKVVVIKNNGTANVFVKIGATATTSNPPLLPQQSITFEMYNGQIDAIAASGSHSVCTYAW